jgi:hypothetical protein
MSTFEFSLTEEEKTYLKDLARLAIQQRLEPGEVTELPPPPTEKLQEHYGAFVTLHLGGNLRGCIGNVIGDRPVHRTIAEMAVSSAFNDPRFMPLTKDEFDRLDIEISILSPVEPCPDPEQVEIGRHGLIVRRGPSTGLLLPQVPVEHKWDRETFLDHTCVKAGLPSGCWRQEDTQIFWFEAEIF